MKISNLREIRILKFLQSTSERSERGDYSLLWMNLPPSNKYYLINFTSQILGSKKQANSWHFIIVVLWSKKVGKLVEFYYCSTTVQKSRQTRGILLLQYYDPKKQANSWESTFVVLLSKKVGKLVGFYYCSTTVQKSRQTRGNLLLQYYGPKSRQTRGISLCRYQRPKKQAKQVVGFYCRSTKVQHELVDYSVRPPSQIFDLFLLQDKLSKPLITYLHKIQQEKVN